ncbi:MAG TPA: hypothetical protein VHH73_02830 [Verrucomicrobiae bacterium]|nr:hypothetical protein [Verrucomicrobiae bacterium]
MNDSPASPPPTVAVAPWFRRPGLGIVLSVLEPLSIAALFVFLLNKSWLRWSDPLIDFPKDLYLSWRVSEGDLLYEKITNWYGPLSHLAEAAAFRVFGVGMDTVVWLNVGLAMVALVLLRAIFGILGNRLSVWLGSVVFVVMFAFGNLSEIANYNFLTPYASQATYTFLGLLLVLWGLLRNLKSGNSPWLFVAGFGFAVAYLDKPEGVLAASGALGIYFLAQAIRCARPARRSWVLSASGWLLGGFLSLWLPIFGYLGWRGGFAYGFRAANYTVVSLLDPSIRAQVNRNPLMQAFFGFDHPLKNFFAQLGAGAELTLVCGAMAILAWRWLRAPKFGPQWWILLLSVTGMAGFGCWLGVKADYWLQTGPAFAFPVMLATMAAAGWCLGAAWRGGADFSRALGLAVVGVAASLMLARMVLNARLSQYGFFMMPLAVWFWIHLVSFEAARPVGKSEDSRTPWLLPAAFGFIVLFATATVLRFEINYYASRTFAVGVGRDRFYTFPPIFTKTGSRRTNGLMLNTMIQAFKLKASHARSLVSFPEGIAVNYHLRVRSPLAEAEFHPLALGYVGPGHVLAELQANPPDAILLCYRNLAEYGVRYFGQDEASGRDIMLWVRAHYVLAGKAGVSGLTMSGNAVDIYIPRPPGRGPPLRIGPF